MFKIFCIFVLSMKNQHRLKNNKTLYFTRWSRKKYAVLASFGKVVHIGKLSVKIADSSLSKLDKSVTLFSEKTTKFYNELSELFEKTSTNFDNINVFSLQLNPIKSNNKNYLKIKILNKN